MASSSGGAGTGPDMVDWDLAVRIGSRLAGEGPQVGRDEADAVVAELRADANRSTGLVRDFTGLVAAEHDAPVLVVDRAGMGAGERRRLPGGDLADGREARFEEGTHRAEPRRRVEDHRRGGGRAARVPGRQGARPVRPLPRPRRQAAAGRAEHRPRGAGARRRPPRLPAVGLPARGDPPGAVHGGAVDARPPVLGDRCDRGDHGAVEGPRRGAAADHRGGRAVGCGAAA